VKTGQQANKARADGEFVPQRERTVVTLREMLLRGELPAGEQILEAPLTVRLGTSRTTIRLALERLAQEGLLTPLPRSGFVVREFTIQDIWDAIETRGVLEGMAARLAAERLEKREEVEPLRRIQAELDAAIQPDGFVQTSGEEIDAGIFCARLAVDFHAVMVDLAKSPMLRWMMGRLTSIPFAAVTAQSASPMPLLRLAGLHHHALIEAIENKEGARAEALAREHARLTRTRLTLMMDRSAKNSAVLAT
jgi:GntR family transcriptional regulator of vanillate catabolism